MRLNFARGPRSKPKHDAWALAFLVLAPFALFLPGLLSGKLLYGYDTLALGLPFHAEVLRCLAAGQWPLWLNGVFGGMPGIASCNLLFLYPTDFIGCLLGLPLRALLPLDAAAHMALAGVGMFLFLRRLGRGSGAAVLGALFFAGAGCELSQVLGGFYNMLEGVAWLPWAFWAAHKARSERSLFAWGLCGAAFALQILAGAAQLFVYTLAAVTCFTLAPWRGAERTRAPKAAGGASTFALAGLGLSVGLAFLLSAPQLWPTLRYLPLTARQGYSHAQFVGGSFSLSEMLTWLVPGLFGWPGRAYHGSLTRCLTSEYFGLLPWALAAAALAASWRRDALTRWMAWLALAALFFGQGRWTPFYALFHHLPVLSAFRDWSRVLLLLTFAVCSLAARGWDALQETDTRARALRGAAAFGVLALGGTFLAWGIAKESAEAAAPAMPWISDKPLRAAALLTAESRAGVRTAWALLAAGAGLLWFTARRPGAGLALLLALAFHGLDLSGMVSRTVRFVEPQRAHNPYAFTLPAPPPPGLEPWRVFDASPLPSNTAMLYGYENLAGVESMPLAAYLRTQAAFQAVPGRWLDWLGLMNVRYILRHSRREPWLPGDGVTPTVNPKALPRAWLVGRALPVADSAAAYRLLADPRFHPQDTVALEGAPADPALRRGARPRGAVTWLKRTPEAFSLAVQTDRPSALVLSNFWYPAWKAAVDGRGTPVLKADGGLQAVLLTAGIHRVDFHYDPSLFYDALAACLAGLAGLFGLWRYEAQSAGRGGADHDR